MQGERCGGSAVRLQGPHRRHAAGPRATSPAGAERRGGTGCRRRFPPSALHRLSPPGGSRMGAKFPGCFPRVRRRRGRGRGAAQEESLAASPDGPPGAPAAPRARSTPSTSSGGGEAEPEPPSGRAYFSGKARVSFRHQLDSERDSTS